MVGMLLDEGLRGGPQPFLRVLEISDVDTKRSTRDLLPYLPRVRMMFSRLPDQASRVRWSVTQVFLDDVECVTQTVVQVSGPRYYLQFPQGKLLTIVLRNMKYRSIYERY